MWKCTPAASCIFLGNIVAGAKKTVFKSGTLPDSI